MSCKHSTAAFLSYSEHCKQPEILRSCKRVSQGCHERRLPRHALISLQSVCLEVRDVAHRRCRRRGWKWQQGLGREPAQVRKKVQHQRCSAICHTGLFNSMPKSETIECDSSGKLSPQHGLYAISLCRLPVDSAARPQLDASFSSAKTALESSPFPMCSGDACYFNSRSWSAGFVVEGSF